MMDELRLTVFPFHHFYFLCPTIANAMPPRIKAVADNNLNETVSAKKITPPIAANAGTESWRIAARVAV